MAYIPVVPLLETTPHCSATPRIVFAMEEMRESYDIALFPEGHFEAKYGMVGPSWVEGKFRLFDGNPIQRHIGRAYGMGTMMPHALDERARVDAWLDFLVLRIGMSFVREQPEQAMKFLRVVDRHLAGRQWLCESFSVADCGYVTLALNIDRLPVGALPHLRDYLGRLTARPAFERSKARLAAARAAAAQ